MGLNEDLFRSKDFDGLYTKNIKFIHGKLKHYANIADPDELLSIASLAFTKSLASFDPDKYQFLTYFGRILNNELLMYYRKNKRHEAVGSIDDTNDISETALSDRLVDKTVNIEKDYEEDDNQRVIMECIDKLDSRQRDCVLLSLRGMNQREIAEGMCTIQPSVNRLLSRARKNLIRLLAERGIIIRHLYPVREVDTTLHKVKTEVHKLEDEMRGNGKLNEKEPPAMSKQEMCYNLFEDGLDSGDDIKKVSQATGVKSNTVRVYLNKWKREKRAENEVLHTEIPTQRFSSPAVVPGKEGISRRSTVTNSPYVGHLTKPEIKPVVDEGYFDEIPAGQPTKVESKDKAMYIEGFEVLRLKLKGSVAWFDVTQDLITITNADGSIVLPLADLSDLIYDLAKIRTLATPTA